MKPGQFAGHNRDQLPIAWGKTVTALKNIPYGSNKELGGNLIIVGDSAGHLSILKVPNQDNMARYLSFTPSADSQIVDIYPTSLLKGLVLTSDSKVRRYSFDLDPALSKLEQAEQSIPGTFTASGYSNNSYQICTVENKNDGTFNFNRFSYCTSTNRFTIQNTICVNGNFHAAYVLANEIVILHQSPWPQITTWPLDSNSKGMCKTLKGDRFSTFEGTLVQHVITNSGHKERLLFATDTEQYSITSGYNVIHPMGTPPKGRIVQLHLDKFGIIEGDTLRDYKID